MIHLQSTFEQITNDADYQSNLDWGRPRRGHPEGTVRAHIEQLERNLHTLERKLPGHFAAGDHWKLRILIHVHDSFKANSVPGVAITDPNSHASLAAAFLRKFCEDHDLLNMVQFHDDPYALWKQTRRGSYNRKRLQRLLETIKDWELFLKFLVIDNMTGGKDPEPVNWAANTIASQIGLQKKMLSYIECLAGVAT